jgi:hypothetical protein
MMYTAVASDAAETLAKKTNISVLRKLSENDKRHRTSVVETEGRPNSLATKLAALQ